MGYSEVLCYLCGVSFNIGRIRTANEPHEAAWDCHGQALKGYVTSWKSGPHGGCFSSSDPCYSAVRGQKRENNDEDDDDESDPDYIYGSEPDNEPYEYESDDDMVEDGDDSIFEGDDGSGDDMDSLWYRAWLEGFKESKEKEKDTFLPLPSHGVIELRLRNLEHISGPNCENRGGYSGRRITAEEMKGCLTVQCLLPKDATWTPTPDDQEFELSSKYFLSGLSDHMPSRDSGSPVTVPERHGVEFPLADNIVWAPANRDIYGVEFPRADTIAGAPADPDAYGMPFHPWCFDIFTRLSRFHLGCVDVNGLMGWWNLRPAYHDFHSFPRDPAVQRAMQQSWFHETGSEYLAANPLSIPRLQPLLHSAVQEDLPGFIAQQGAFINPSNSNTSAATDPFLDLPQELRLAIVHYLGSCAIASLRLASRAFRQLPISLWYRLLRQEIPWLWEVWSDEKPYFWATLTARDIQAIPSLNEQVSHDFQKELQTYRDVIRSEMPSLLEAWRAAEPDINQLLGPPGCSWPPVVASPVRLPFTGTNWYQLYTDITRHWGELKGLQNRRRIWKDVEEIVRGIVKEREGGRLWTE